MTTDIDRARRKRWMREFSYDVHVTWPRGMAGLLFLIATLLMPVWLLFIGAWLARCAKRRRDPDRGSQTQDGGCER